MMKDEITYHNDGSARSFSGPAAMNVYAMAVLASALRLYATSGIRVNRMYTPSRMLSAGRTYLGDDARAIAARDYSGMADALIVPGCRFSTCVCLRPGADYVSRARLARH